MSEVVPANTEKVQIQVPDGCTGGEMIEICVKNVMTQVLVPAGVTGGQTIEIEVPRQAPAQEADDSIEGNEEKEVELAEQNITSRIKMSSRSALCRIYALNFWTSMCFGIYLLVTVQFWTKYAFDGEVVDATYYLAARGTLQGILRAYSTSIFGHISDRTNRKKWLAFSQATSACSLCGWGVFGLLGQKPLQAFGWASVLISLGDPVWGTALVGFTKDVVPEHLYNRAKIPATHKHYTYTKIGQDAIAQVTLSLGFLAGNIIAVILLVTMKNEAVIMIIAGILYLANCFLVGILLPESIDPAYSKNSSLKQYFTGGEFKTDLNIFRNIHLLTTSPVLRGAILWWFLEQIMSANASVVVNYITYRWGMGADWLIMLFLIGALGAIPSVLLAPKCNQCLGEAKSATMRNMLQWFHNVFFWVNGFGKVYYMPFAFAVGILYFGQVTVYSWPSRLSDYHMQSELVGTVLSVKAFADASLRLPYAALMQIGYENTKLKNYGGTYWVKDCGDKDKLAKWCTWEPKNSTNGVPLTPQTDVFTMYGEGWNGKQRKVNQSQARVMVAGKLTREKCDINDYETVTDGEGVWECFCEWESIRCPDPPPADAKIGGVFDPLITPFYLSGSAGIASAVWFLIYLFKLKPISAMKSQERREITKWRQATFKKLPVK